MSYREDLKEYVSILADKYIAGTLPEERYLALTDLLIAWESEAIRKGTYE